MSDSPAPERPEPASDAPVDDAEETAAPDPVRPPTVARFRAERATATVKADRRRFVRRWWPVPVVLVLLAGAGLFVLLHEPSAETVVAEYLETVRSGDIEGALAYTEDIGDLDSASTNFLTADAVRDDWSVGLVTQRHPGNVDPVDVDVTITGADGTTGGGRFQLTETDDGWRIDNPLIKLDISTMPVDFAQFNDVTSTDDTVWLFPGVYSVFGDSADLFDPGLPGYVALPWSNEADEQNTATQALFPLLTPTDAFNELLDAQARDWIDDCAAGTELAPDNCPFAVSGSVDYGPTIHTDTGYYEDVEDVGWQVDEYPTAQAVQSAPGFEVQTVAPGRMTLTATATSADDEKDVDITAVCDLSLDGTVVTLATGNEFRFTADPQQCEPRET